MFLLRPAAFVLFLLTTATAFGQTANRVIDDIDVSVHAAYADVSILFTCQLRYLSHLPSGEGSAVRIRTAPQRDCMLSGDGVSAPTLPTLARGLIASMDLDRPLQNEIDISIVWKRSERFVIVPTSDGRGIRIRLLRSVEPTGRVAIGADGSGRAASYALNLESSREPFPSEALTKASSIAGVRVYVSETKVADEHWYRLRAGPFISESDAKRSLISVRDQYPKAWLAIGDDETLSAEAVRDPVTQALVRETPSRTTLTVAEIDAILKQARVAFRKKDYATAIPLLTKVLEQPEFPERAEAQELIGLSHERSRQIAHAKAEYEEYLRRYPNGSAASRVAERLRALAFAARKSVRGLADANPDSSPWKIFGAFSQLYRRDDSVLENSAVTTQSTNQNALLNDFSFVARRRGQRYDFSSRVSAGYAKSFLDSSQTNGAGDQTRVSTAFVELADREWNWRSRVGRQSTSGSGVLGVFDGAYADYQWRPRWRFSLSVGAPVESTRSSYSSDRQFIAAAVNYGPVANAFDISTYAITQTYQGETDRRALGTEIHYFQPGRTVIGLVDYDFYYGEINNVLVLATAELPARWTLNLNVDRRQSPVLSVRNALIGQTATTLEELQSQFTRDEIDQLARDRTSVTELYSVSASRLFGERWQWTFDVSSISIGATTESGGVEATPEMPRELAYSALAIGNSILTSGDVEVLAIRYQAGDLANTTSVGLSSRWPLWGAWRIMPRVRADYRVTLADDSTQTIYTPSLRLDYQYKRFWFELEAGTELGKRDVGTSFEKTRRNYLSAGYRYSF